jgi:hypothetical protein
VQVEIDENGILSWASAEVLRVRVRVRVWVSVSVRVRVRG